MELLIEPIRKLRDVEPIQDASNGTIYTHCVKLLSELAALRFGNNIFEKKTVLNRYQPQKKPKLALPPPKMIFETDHLPKPVTASLDPPVNGTLAELSEFLKDYAESQMTSVPYTLAPLCWFELYSDACLILALNFGLSEGWDDIANYHTKASFDGHRTENTIILPTLNKLDLALIVAGAPGWRHSAVQKLIDFYERVFCLNTAPKPDASFFAESLAEDLGNSLYNHRKLLHPVKRFPSVLGIANFTNMINSDDCEPFIIENVIGSWPAFMERSSWANPSYLISVVGKYRLVPVEIGSKYTDPNWTQKLMYFGDYINLVTSGDQTAYLAQHNLFKQSASLKSDFSPPDYCFVDAKCFSSSNSTTTTKVNQKQKQCCGKTELVTNAWLGPKNSVSPLHFDNFHNLFAQVVGYKYVKLVSHRYNDCVYPFSDSSLLSNTSMVDAEFPDIIQFPKFSDAAFSDCIVGPGDLLYIPPRYWHYLRALSASVSISMWF